jgi:minor extracellular serine protease Vpr
MRRFGLSFLIFMIPVCAWSRDLPRYAVFLNDPAPAAAPVLGGRNAIQAAANRVSTAQQAVRSELRSRNITVTGSSHVLLNAIFVAADPAEADRLKSIPGVSDVVPLKRFHRNLDRAVQLINVPAAWNLLGGTRNAGAGIRIGVIDTGIQSSHPAFQDPALVPPAGFPVCQSSDCAFTNNKIIVARSYVSMLEAGSAADSRPDDLLARDRVGHGTAVAMAAAGVTNSGPSDTITGVAPKAFLGSYKVFGSPEINDFTTGDAVISALEDAFTDQMDIVILSLGAPAFYAPLDSGRTCGLNLGQQCDPEAAAVQSAVNAGMVVVAAAGNQGATGGVQPSLNTIDSPGDAPGAIAVAATANSHSWANALTVAGLGTYHARYGNGPQPTTVVSGPLGDVATAGDPLACNPVPAGSLAGLIALLQRGTCTFAIKIQNLQVAGAAGAIITNNPGDNSLLTPGGLGGTTIPAVFVGYDDGQAIRAWIAGHNNSAVSIDSTINPFDLSTYNLVAPFSSHGPVLGSNALKPDIAAVGVDLYLAGQTYDPNGDLYTPTGYLISQGTSFSTPQVAGVAALVKQAHPNLSAIQIKSAIVNTATQDLTDGGLTASVLAAGAGKVNAASAVATNLVASPATVSFGAIRSGALPVTQRVQLTNIGTSTLNLSVSINRRTPENNAHTSIDSPNLSIPAGQNGSINLLLSGSAPAPGIYEGFVVIQGAASVVQIPYLYIMGDGVPYDLIPIAGDGDSGTVGRQPAFGYVVLQINDQYGVPVANVPTQFSVISGGGQLLSPTLTTDIYGIAFAETILGSTPGANVYSVAAGALSASYTATGRLQPTIASSGVVNAANFSQGVAPGSYVAVFGNNLAQTTRSYNTPYLPLAIDQVSVSFDAPGVSVPGHLVFVSPGQVNVQIPWELAGQSSAQMKVSLANSSGALYTLPLAGYSPAFFEIQGIAAALDETNRVVTAANPVAQGHVVQLFANGLGPVTNQPLSGDPAPSATLAETTTTPIVTIGGKNAQVLFSGLTPGNAALYQMNVVVPNTGTGSQPITVSIGNLQSAMSHLPVR